MKEIVSKKKVVTNPRTGEENIVCFKNITVSQNTSNDVLNVRMDVYKEVEHQHIVVAGGEEHTQTTKTLIKIETISDKYSKEISNPLIASKTIPSELDGDDFETRRFLYVSIAKDIIVNDSDNYFKLKDADLEIR